MIQFWVFLAVASLGGLNLAVADTIKVGVVDMQRALQTVGTGKKAKEKLEAEFNKKRAELQKEEAEIKKLHEEFQKQSLVMTEQARGKKQAELQQRILKFQETTQRSQMDIQKREQELTEPLITRMRDVIRKLAQDKGYSVVLEKNENMVLFSLDRDDLTQEVIQIFDKNNKS